jgi:hypothetical protein
MYLSPDILVHGFLLFDMLLVPANINHIMILDLLEVDLLQGSVSQLKLRIKFVEIDLVRVLFLNF